jgi:ribosome maturation factor RimP
MGKRESKKAKARKIEEILLPILEEEDAELFDLYFTGPARRSILRVLIEKEGGVTVDLCARVSRKLSIALDVADTIHHSYTLEVSSPGIERPLTKPLHYQRYKGHKAKIKTYGLIDKQRVHIGTILDFIDDSIHLQIDENQRIIPFSQVAKANLYIEDFGL